MQLNTSNEYDFSKLTWSNVARGSLHGNILDLEWADVPLGNALGNGKLTLRQIDMYNLTATGKTGSSFGCTNWKRQKFHPIRRWYDNSSNGDHFLANSTENISILLGQRFLEFDPYFLLASEKYRGTTALYRFWNSDMKNHFCCTDPNAEGASGWSYEGILGYIACVQFNGTVPLYRYWNNSNGDHLFSLDKNAEGASGYAHEGITGYVWIS